MKLRKGDVEATMHQAGNGPAPYYVRHTNVATGHSEVVARDLTDTGLRTAMSRLRNDGFAWQRWPDGDE